jgi:putative SOS response-associated peptidase YedK
MRWGLIPSWSKDMKGGFSTFNARADGIDTKPEGRPPLPGADRRLLRMAQGWPRRQAAFRLCDGQS